MRLKCINAKGSATRTIELDKTYVVTKLLTGGYVALAGIYGSFNISRFVLAADEDQIEDAKARLIEAGYQVTDPAPKLSGTIALYRYTNPKGPPLFCAKEQYDGWLKSLSFGRNKTELIAVLPWTEGDGL